MDLKKKIEEILANYWLNGNHYCGMSAYQVLQKITNELPDISEDDIKKAFLEMEEEGLISTREIECGDRISWVWQDNQFIENIDLGPHIDLWGYPQKKVLEKYDDSKVEDVGIYTKQLRLGGSQIEHRFFKRQVLERYRDDPRYVYEEEGASGYICIKDEYYLDEKFPEEDKILIQSFGVAYDEYGNEIVAVILSDLGSLPLKHQYYWHSYEVLGKCKLDADYVDTHFEAQFTDRVSIFRALCQEIVEINKICEIIGEPFLFRDTYENGTPSKYGLLSKPTDGEYYEFIQILDKMLSDNINKNYFKEKIELTEEQPIMGDKIKIIDKGTIRLLEEYLDTYWRFPDPRPKEEIIETLKEIRRQRQIPAHKINSDNFDQANIDKQKEIIARVYRALRQLRIILSLHPLAISYEPPKWLEQGRII